MNKIYEVVNICIDSRDGMFGNVLFTYLSDAIDYCKKEIPYKRPKNIIEDIEGKLLQYDGKDLNYSPSRNCPAIYYHSYYGNYRCVIFVRERELN